MASIISAGTTSGTSLNLSGDTSGVLQLASNGSTTAVTINTSQNVGIGTSSPANRFHVYDASNATVCYLQANNTSIYLKFGNSVAQSGFIGYEGSGGTNMTFYTANTERMRITSGGYTKMSNTGTYVNSTGNYHEMVGDSVSDTVVIRASSGSLNGSIVYVDANRNTTNNTFYAINYYNNGAGAYKFRVADSGNVTNTNGTYGTISDIKNKENIVDATPKLDKVNQLKVRNYNFIGDDLKQIGFVAQEFEQVFPSMVEEHPDKDAEGNDLGTTTKSIKTSVLIPILVKAIQEQQAMIETLQAEVQALKGTAL
jgi:hypothetical protein